MPGLKRGSFWAAATKAASHAAESFGCGVFSELLTLTTLLTTPLESTVNLTKTGKGAEHPALVLVA